MLTYIFYQAQGPFKPPTQLLNLILISLNSVFFLFILLDPPSLKVIGIGLVSKVPFGIGFGNKGLGFGLDNKGILLCTLSTFSQAPALPWDWLPPPY